MNILSWAALAVLTYCALRGWRRGLIMTVFSMFATVIAIAISAQLSPQLSRTWQNTAFYEIVSERVEMTLFKGQDSQNDGEEGEDNRGVINSLPLPDVVQNVLASNDDAQNNMLGVSAFRKYIADSVTGIILNILCAGFRRCFYYNEDYHQMSESAQPSAGYSYNEQDGRHACWFAEGVDLALADLYCDNHYERNRSRDLSIWSDQ